MFCNLIEELFGLADPEMSTLFSQSFQLAYSRFSYLIVSAIQFPDSEERDDSPNAGHSTSNHLTRLLAQVHCKKVKESRYRPEAAQRVPGS
jgi:hypothetical protein